VSGVAPISWDSGGTEIREYEEFFGDPQNFWYDESTRNAERTQTISLAGIKVDRSVVVGLDDDGVAERRTDAIGLVGDATHQRLRRNSVTQLESVEP
jgi:hypothetical protein